MRPIDADALIADCQLAQKQADRHGREFASAFYSGGGEISTEWWCVEDMIENAPTVEPKTMQWIPCSERMPEVREWVLCQCREGIMDVLRLTEDGDWNKIYPHVEYMSGFVIAWMPLPEPYKEQNNE